MAILHCRLKTYQGRQNPQVDVGDVGSAIVHSFHQRILVEGKKSGHKEHTQYKQDGGKERRAGTQGTIFEYITLLLRTYRRK